MGFTLLHKTSGLNEGDRVALIYSTGEPINVTAALYGCLSVNILPLMVDPPISRDGPGVSQVGFLLGSLGVSYAVTSESTYRNLPRDESGHLQIFKGNQFYLFRLLQFILLNVFIYNLTISVFSHDVCFFPPVK